MSYQALLRNLFTRSKYYRGVFGLVGIHTTIDIVPFQPDEPIQKWGQLCQLRRENTLTTDDLEVNRTEMFVKEVRGVHGLNLTGHTFTTPFATQSDDFTELDAFGVDVMLDRFGAPACWAKMIKRSGAR